MPFVTPLWEIKTAPADKFLSLAFDDSGDKNNPHIYYYKNSTEIKKVKIPDKGFKRIVLATSTDGTVLYVGEDGKISKESTPLGV